MNTDLPTTSRIADPGIRALYALPTRWQAWLDVEVALARAQAELGMIPAEAPDAIAAKARLELMDSGRIDEGFERTGHPIVPLIWELSRLVGEPYGGWVHWGATTQNIVESGDLLVIARVHDVFRSQIRDLLHAMADLADRGADMPMAGRTHGQHAVPITFGYKVASWIDQIIRHLDRLDEAKPRIFSAVLGGAAGTYASFGEYGRKAQTGMARHLGLGEVTHPSRAIIDTLAENIMLMGLLAAIGSRVGREIYELMKTEFGEVEEPVPPGTVGSSTMPQKRNPKLAQDVVALAAQIRAQVPIALEAVQTEHEADRTTSLMIQAAGETASVATGDMLARLVMIIRELTLHPDRMRRNLDLSDGLIMAEAVMLRLGQEIGRQHAHDVVYDAAQNAAIERRSMVDLLLADARVNERLSAAEIKALVDPVSYTGLSAVIAREAAERARRRVA